MLIRKIKSISCWDIDRIKEKIHREDATAPGDSIADLRTVNNRLSVWYTPDLEDKNLMPVLTAMALGRDSIQKFTYVVMDEAALADMGISATGVKGAAPGVSDPDILNRHRDLTDIDHKRLGMLAEYIFRLVKNRSGRTISEKDIKKNIHQLISECRIEKDGLNSGIGKDL